MPSTSGSWATRTAWTWSSQAADVIVNELGRDDVHFALLGFGDTLEDLKALATELGLDDHVTFTGRVGPAEIARVAVDG